MRAIAYLVADIAWEFRWQTWAVRYLKVVAWLMVRASRLASMLAQHTLDTARWLQHHRRDD